MIAVLLVQWGASLLGLLAAAMIISITGYSTDRITIACILTIGGLIGRLFWRFCRGFSAKYFIFGSLLFYLSIIIFLYCLGRLDLGVSRRIADTYALLGTGPSIGLLILQWALLPLPFGMAGWRSRRRKNS